MPVLVAAPTLGDLLKFELNPSYCRDTVILKGGAGYTLGAVLGKIAASGKYRLSPVAAVAGDEGAETAAAVLTQAVDASLGDAIGVVVARGPVILSEAALAYDASVGQAADKDAKKAQLSQAGLVVRIAA